MNNEKEIERIRDLLSEFDDGEYNAMATCLVNAGIGDKKQAVKEFMEKFQFNLEEKCVSVAGFDLEDIEIDGQDVIEQLRNTFAELYEGND